ncbi:ribosomal protein L11 methyltransferase [Bacteroidia bacterium]|nr:ribosomal protein L11 methyltransferase [Bacteroidia bacterium]
MDYYELKLTLAPNTEINRDILAALLVEAGFESFVESGEGLEAYAPENVYSEEKLVEILNNPPIPDTSVNYQVEFIKNQNWNEEWEKNSFRPIIIDNQLIIHSSFHADIPDLPYKIVIDPKMAFGTGNHSTTALMISYLLDLDLQGKSFLDMGCGTAVLAIFAQMKGADRITAIDNDTFAYENSLENITLNHTPTIEVKLGDVGLLGKETYDFVFANINRNILLHDIPAYINCMNPGASLFVSGFFSEDLPMIQETCIKNGLTFISRKEENNWVAAQFALKI